MATMGAKKRMVARIIHNNRAKREDAGKETHERVMTEVDKVTPQDHNARLDMLKSLGIMKK
jgi:hypothetical protein